MARCTSILFIQLELPLLSALQKALQRKHIYSTVAHDWREGINYGIRHEYDLILINCATEDGIRICARLRARNIDTPIMAIMAESSESQMQQILNAGADHFISPPYSVEGLVSRINAILRRPPSSNVEQIEIGDLQINKSAREVAVKGSQVSLQRREYNILLMLAENRGRVIRRELLNDATASLTNLGQDTSIDVHISKIRRKLKKAGANYQIIDTVYGVGYKIK